ncbi:MAG: hypothetical protein JW913_18470 [Chitinispirillaceae bacterium]|nr:hypothetical protein [Chitinispirillaceae bacterium]
MNKPNSIITFSCLTLILSCSNDHQSHNPVAANGESGVLKVSVNIGRVGALSKKSKAADIEMTDLYVVFSADGYDSIFDTIPLGGGSDGRTEEEIYPAMAARYKNKIIEWTLRVEARDQNDNPTHWGDTVFSIRPKDTTDVTLTVEARYSMLKANFIPIRDSVTRCVLDIDNGDHIVDSSFEKQSLVGNTVTLSYDYLTASTDGEPHTIKLDVFGELWGIDTMLYTGTTDITVLSGEEGNYKVPLAYKGPKTLHGAADMVVTLGTVGTVSMDGILIPDGLVLWNKLGSQDEVENSEVGPDGFIYGTGTNFVTGQFGNGFTSGSANSGPNFGLWETINPDYNLRGTVEFWWKPARDYNEGNSAPDQLFVSGIWQDPWILPFQLMYRWREGTEGMGGFEFQTSSHYLRSGKVVPFNTDDWVHVAFVWDMDGLPDHSDAFYGVYVNESYYQLYDALDPSGTINYPMDKPIGAYFSMGYYDADGNNQCQGVIDNIKIYNYAKTDFSDRFIE